MNFADCLRNAVDGKEIDQGQADDLLRRYNAHLAANAAEPVPEAAAKAALAKELDAAAVRKQRLADLTAAKTDEIKAFLESYRDAKDRPDVYEAAMRLLENFGYSGYSAVVGRSHAIVSLIQGRMADVLDAFERNFYTGVRHDKPLARDVIREMFGEATGRPEARAFADAITAANNELRERFNVAGGDVGELDGGYVAQSHNALAVKRATFEKWRDFILPKLDLDKMRDPLTGGPLIPARLEESLKAAWDNIVTGGQASREPSRAPQGRGAVANQRGEHRFLHFKTAEDWLAYDREFGSGDPVKAIFQHINGMARDIAAMEVLGPNPGATVEWLKQVALSEHAKGLTGEPSLFNNSAWTKKGEMSAGRQAAQSIGDLWEWARGRPVVNQQMVDFFGDARNLLTAAQLGSAGITAATTDPAIMRAEQQALGMGNKYLFSGNAKIYLDAFGQLPLVRNVLGPWLTKMAGAPRAEALRSGMIADEFLHIMGDEARYAGTLNGGMWSRWLADRTLMLSGLTPITESRRAVFRLELQGFVADHAGTAFAALPQRLRTKLAGYGFDAAQWDALRATALYYAKPNAAGLLRPMDVADRALAERYIEFILGETERAVPTTTLRSKAAVLGGGPRGHAGNELFNSFLQYRSFGLSLLTLQMEAVQHEAAGFGATAATRYAVGNFIAVTLGGAAALQLKQIANGRDPQNMKDWKFWMAGAATGGGLGIFGDFLFADLTRYDASFGQQIAGPGVGLVTDLGKLTMGNFGKLLHGDKTTFGKDMVQIGARYTPVVSSLWYTRLAFQRELVDQLQYQVDPYAHRRWREMERKAMRERGQGFYWRPGDPLPNRLPDLTRALGR